MGRTSRSGVHKTPHSTVALSASNLSCMCAQPAHRQILHSVTPWCPQAPCLHMGIGDTFFLWPAACHGHSYLHTLRRCKESAAHQVCPALACCFCTWAVKVGSRAFANCRHALAYVQGQSLIGTNGLGADGTCLVCTYLLS